MNRIVAALSYVLYLLMYACLGALIHFFYLAWVPLAACILGALIFGNLIFYRIEMKAQREPKRAKEI